MPVFFFFFFFFEFLVENNLSSTQSGFKRNDSCVDQLISVTDTIFSAFDANPPLEVRDVFLALLKSFGEVE